MRAKIWRTCLIGDDLEVHNKRKTYYSIICNYPYNVNEDILNIIKKDLPRTHIQGINIDTETIETLLCQYTKAMPCDSYVQGFAYLMAVLYHVYENNDREHAMADTFWSFGTVLSIVRCTIPDHDPIDFKRFTDEWKVHYIAHLQAKSHRTHNWLTPFYDVLLPSLTVKWLMLWFTQQFDIGCLLKLWDAIITCNASRRTKLFGIIAANITLQHADKIEYWAETSPTEIGPRLMCIRAKDAQIIVEESRNVMIEYNLPGF